MCNLLNFHRFYAKDLTDFYNRIKLHSGNAPAQSCGQRTVGNICGNGKLPQAYIVIKNQIPKFLFPALGCLHGHHPFFCLG